MQEKLRKHILSEYAVLPIEYNAQQPKKNMQVQSINGPSVLTENIENSDPDEFELSGPSYLTHAIEESDPDEFYSIGPSMETRRIEVSDPDEMCMGPTQLTFIIESSDEDEFLLI